MFIQFRIADATQEYSFREESLFRGSLSDILNDIAYRISNTSSGSNPEASLSSKRSISASPQVGIVEVG